VEAVFALLERFEQETLNEIVSPAEDKRTEFHYGRVHGQLLACRWIAEQLRDGMEAQARIQERREREF